MGRFCLFIPPLVLPPKNLMLWSPLFIKERELLQSGIYTITVFAVLIRQPLWHYGEACSLITCI